MTAPKKSNDDDIFVVFNSLPDHAAPSLSARLFASTYITPFARARTMLVSLMAGMAISSILIVNFAIPLAKSEPHVVHSGEIEHSAPVPPAPAILTSLEAHDAAVISVAPTDGETHVPPVDELITLGQMTGAASFSGGTADALEVPADGSTATSQADTVISPAVTEETAITPLDSPALVNELVYFKLIQDEGVKSGFWLNNRKDPAQKRYFLVVEPTNEDNQTVEWEFTNIATSDVEVASKMAVEVPEETFSKIAIEIKDNGKLGNDILGVASGQSKDIEWRISTVDSNLLAGWDIGKSNGQ